MASILDRYGIKEVADVTFYTIDETTGKPETPVYYFDTLKVSTIEQTSENTSARGGKGNPELISWDYNKEITLTIEDALFSPKSLALMMGAQIKNNPDVSTSTAPMQFTRKWNSDQINVPTTGASIDGKFYIFNTNYTANNISYYTATGASVEPQTDESADNKLNWEYVTFTVNPTAMETIAISPDKFAGTYYITGDTYARSEANGEDELFQFICPKGKVNTENTLTMEAEGDPSTYEMTIKVMKPTNDQPMLSLIKYKLGN